ncbi:MAG: hypothetical protein ACOX6I_06930 [Syntrophomonadaceae bacterium]|jgi:hypothetical protein
MEKEVKVVFHNHGLRSFIEVDLCRECPRQDGKGCCGNYSPVFYPVDLAYLTINKPELIDYIFSLKDATILDASVTINNDIDGESYKCKFHSTKNGCILSQDLRESICRHFVCPGIGLWLNDDLKEWKMFFDKLFAYEIDLNNKLAARLAEKGLTLRNPALRPDFMQELLRLYTIEVGSLPDFIKDFPQTESRTITRSIEYNQEWPL